MLLLLEGILLVLMWAVTIVSIYRRRTILGGRVVYTSGRDWRWQVGMTIISIIFAIPAIFFLVVLIASAFKGIELDLGSLFIACTAIIFFGNLANNFSPWRSRTIMTDRGVIYPLYATGGWSWSRINNFEWSKEAEKKSFQLTIEVTYFGFLNRPIPLRGHFDSEAKQNVDNLLKRMITAQSFQCSARVFLSLTATEVFV